MLYLVAYIPIGYTDSIRHATTMPGQIYQVISKQHFTLVTGICLCVTPFWRFVTFTYCDIPKITDNTLFIKYLNKFICGCFYFRIFWK